MQPKTYTSALTLIISDPSSSHVRYEPYLPSLHCASNQEFTDRAEDIIIKTPNPSLVARSGNIPVPFNFTGDNYDGQDNEYVTLQVSDTSAFATYKSSTSLHSEQTTDNSKMQTTTLGRAKLKDGKGPKMVSLFDPNRKASLQVTPQTKSQSGGYERLDSYTSESSINQSSADMKRSRFESGSRGFYSEDNLYESTATITSTVRSDSMDTTLISLEEESSKASLESMDLLMQTIEDLNTGVSSTSRDANNAQSSDYASVKKVKKNKFDSELTEMQTLHNITGHGPTVVERQSEVEHVITSFSHPTQRPENPHDKIMIDFEGHPIEDNKHSFLNSSERSESLEILEKSKIFSATKPKRNLSKDDKIKVVVDERQAAPSKRGNDEPLLQRSMDSGGSKQEYERRIDELGIDHDSALNEHMEGLMIGMNMDPAKWFNLHTKEESITPIEDDWQVPA